MEIFTKIGPILSSRLHVLQETVNVNVPTFIVEAPTDSTTLTQIRGEVEGMGYTMIVRNSKPHELTISVLPKFVPPKVDLRWNIGLFLATAATVFLSGYLFFNGVVGGLEYLGTLFGILVTHEASHFFMSRRHRVAATLPYFIPSIPPIGTFGAVIRAREPFKDRNQLLDIGLAGPLGGFAVAVAATFVGVFTSPTIPIQQASHLATLPFTPLLMYLLTNLYIPSNKVLVLNAVAFASWVGLVVTFLNALPTAQLDGGHVLRSLVGQRLHSTISLIVGLAVVGLGVVVNPGFLLMGFLMLFLSYMGHPGPLDDFTKVSKNRVILYALWVVLLVLSLPI
ncbi:MAG: site-2 protease family protein [Thermoprotei archaeon]